jgi:hypothetical protein
MLRKITIRENYLGKRTKIVFEVFLKKIDYLPP